MNYLPSIIISTSDDLLAQANLDSILTGLDLPTKSTHPDIITIDHLTGWGIDQIRRLHTVVLNRPIKANARAIVIHQAQNLTIEAQNSLLKILEEPPPSNTFILLADNLASLSDTIKSRCQIIRLNSNQIDPSNQIVISGKIGDNLNLSSQLSRDKGACLDTIKNQIVFFQKQLVKKPSLDTKHKIRLLQKSLSMINSNVNPTSALDFFFLSL